LYVNRGDAQRGQAAAALLSPDACERSEPEREVLRLLARGEQETSGGEGVLSGGRTERSLLVRGGRCPHWLLEWKRAGGDGVLLDHSVLLYSWLRVKLGDRPLGIVRDWKN
jgi:hypothetical protein